MSRTTKQMLESKVNTLNSILGRPMEPVAMVNGHPQWQIGNISINRQSGWYSVEVITGDAGSVTTLEGGMSARECHLYLSGLVRGADMLKTQQGQTEA